MPVYNEEQTVSLALERALAAELIEGVEKEIVVVDDGSSDATPQLIESFARNHPGSDIRIFRLPENKGKGAALRKGIQEASGDYIAIQDADLEYDPAELNLLLRPIYEGKADVVYGSRFTGGGPHRVLFFWHYLGNKSLTLFSNLLTNLNLSDMETCYKMFRAELIKRLKLREDRFGFEPEVTAKIAKLPDVRICEVGISYHGRTYKQGKKIKWKDGVQALCCILRYNLFC